MIHNLWVDVSEQNDSIFWNLLTNDDINKGNVKYKTDIDEEREGNEYVKENEQCVTNAHPTESFNLEGPNVDPSKIATIALTGGTIPVSLTNE